MMKQVKIKQFIVTIVVSFTSLCLSAAALADANKAELSLLERGAYLAKVADCMACHTVKGEPSYAGGYVFPMQMGNIVSSNITSSKKFGIGRYTEEQFKRAVKEGIRADGTYLYPAMPYTEYSKITDQDITALYAYFKAAKAVNEAPKSKSDLKFPFNLPGLMLIWNSLYLDSKPFVAQAGVSDELNRGRYLVELAHCTTCHTPRNAMMASNSSLYLGGGVVNGWFAPNITSDAISGIGGWSIDELVQYFKNGHVPKKGQAGGGMAEAVEYSLKYLKDADLKSIAVYIKTVPPIRNPAQKMASYAITAVKPIDVASIEIGNRSEDEKMNASKVVNGAVLYNAACASCHGMNGEGAKDGSAPSLTQNTAVGAMEPNNLVMAIAFGIQRSGADKEQFMPAFAIGHTVITNELSDEQIAAVANYVIEHFGQSKIKLSRQQVATIKNGGEVPLLIKAAPYLAVIGFLVGLLVIFWLIRKIFRRS